MEKVTKTAEELAMEREALKIAEREAIEAARQRVRDAEEALKEAKTDLRLFLGRKEGHRGPTGVGEYIKTLIAEGDTNEAILEKVVEKFPHNFTSVNSINWYRNAVSKWPNGKRPAKE